MKGSYLQRVGYMKPFVLYGIIAPSIKVSNEFGNGRFFGSLTQTTSGQKYVVTKQKHVRI